MSLRRKNLIAIVATLISLVLVLFVVSQFIILRQFDEQQQDTVRLNMDRATMALDRELDNLSSITSDWAYWDDTYEFAQDRNQAYIDSNLTGDTLDNLDLDFMLFVDNQGQTIFLGTRQEDNEITSSNTLDMQPDAMRSLLDLPTFDHANRGIILIAQRPTLVTSRAILQSTKTGTPRGMLIIGRYLNQARINDISQQTQLSLMFMPFDSSQLSSDFAKAKSALIADQAPAFVYVLEDQMAEGYSFLNDILGKPILLLQVQSRNRIYQAGQQAVFYILVTLLVTGLVFGVVIIWLTERIVISRLAYMDRRVKEISSSSDLSARIKMSGDDELARLAMTINDSLAKQEQSQEQQFRALNTELTRVNSELKEKIADLKANQKYKDRFFSHASHELRTPLAILQNRLYLARRKPDQWDSHIDELEETLSRLLNVIDDIFDLTKLQDHNLTLTLRPIDLKTYMPMVLDGESTRLEEKCLSLRQEFTDDNLRVNIDFTYFGRACEKLLTFMHDFCEPNHEILFQVQKCVKTDKAYASIELSSTGMHFKSDEIPQMFTPFHQVSEGNILSSGLNLAIAKQIVLLHEGTLDATVDELKGGCFQIKMPMAVK